MTDGWYRVTRPDGKTYIHEVIGNMTSVGSVHQLKEQGCLLEEVNILTNKELEKTKRAGTS